MGNPPLDTLEILIRGVEKNKLVWNPDHRVVDPSPGNFILRPRDFDGLSVERKRFITYAQACQRGRFIAFLGISVKAVLELNLTVELKSHSPSGAVIVGLPTTLEVDAARYWAERLRDAFIWDLPPSVEVMEHVKQKHSTRH